MTKNTIRRIKYALESIMPEQKFIVAFIEEKSYRGYTIEDIMRESILDGFIKSEAEFLQIVEEGEIEFFFTGKQIEIGSKQFNRVLKNA